MSMKPGRNVAAFILTHGRADHVQTYGLLRRNGYTGPIYLLVDNEDTQLDAYKAKYGAEVIVFDKQAVFDSVDTYDLSQDKRVILPARVVTFDVAEQLGISHFLQLDDDYSTIGHRRIVGTSAKQRAVRHLDQLFDAMLDFLENTGATTVAFAQGGDLLGGAQDPMFKAGIKRKAMNSFFAVTAKRIPFQGRINEDVNTYVLDGSRGGLYFTIPYVSLTQGATQKNGGGMTGTYLDQGTYVKSFYTVIAAPSCTTISQMGQAHRRYHHRIRWDHAVPKILSSQYQR